MSTLLVWKKQIQKIYAVYSFYILRALQFVLGICVFGSINSNIGFIEVISSGVCTVVLSAVFAFLPLNAMVLAAVVLMLVQLYELSLIVAGMSLAIFLVMYILYIRFAPQKAWLLLVPAVAFVFKIPFVIPVAFGLLGTPAMVVPAALGTMVYYILHSVRVTSSALQSGGEKAMLDSILLFTNQVIVNKEMWMMVMVIILSLLIVYGVRTRAINHAWKTASVVGAVVAASLSVIGSILLDIRFSVGMIVLSSIAAIITGLVLEFFFLAVDYSRIETLQFEDDEYYYYVKAIPKIGVAVPEKQVKHITEPHEEKKELSGRKMNSEKSSFGKKRFEPELQETLAIDTAQVNEKDLEKSVDELLLTRSLNEELGLEKPQDKVDLGMTRSIESLRTKE